VTRKKTTFLSATKIQTDRNCPYQRKHEKFQRGEPLDYGDAAHECVAVMFDALRRQALTGEEIDPTIHTKAFAKKANALGLKVDNYTGRLLESLAWFRSDDRTQISPENIVSIESEDGNAEYYGKKFFEVEMIPGVWGLRGKMDLVEARDDGTLVIWDWKTGFSEPEDDLQLAIYALAAWKMYPGFPVIETRFAFLDRKTVDWSRWDEQTLVPALEYVDELARTFIARTTYPRTPHKGCGYCSLKNTCPEYQKQITTAVEPAKWDIPATLSNLPQIIDWHKRADALEKMAKQIKNDLDEKRKALLVEHGDQVIGGKAYHAYEATTSYDHDLSGIFQEIQEVIERPPMEVFKFDSAGCKALANTLDKDAKKAVEEIVKRYRSPKNKTTKVKVTVAKVAAESIPSETKTSSTGEENPSDAEDPGNGEGRAEPLWDPRYYICPNCYQIVETKRDYLSCEHCPEQPAPLECATHEAALELKKSLRKDSN
jgi:hypothetical protein